MVALRRLGSLLLVSATCLTLLAALAPATEARAAERCSPLSASEWASRCLSHRDEIESLLRRLPSYRALADYRSFRPARDLLVAGGYGGECRQALRELLALGLNFASLRLGRDCCVETASGRVRLGDVLERHAERCAERVDCERARRFLHAANDASRVGSCAGDDDDDGGGGGRGDDDRDDHDHGDDDSDDRHHDDDDSDDHDHGDDDSDGGRHGGRGDRDHDHDHGDDRGEDRGDCCRPRSKGFWHRQCMGLGEIRPGGGGGPGLHPAYGEDELRRIMRGADRRLAPLGVGACEALDQRRYRSPEGRAEAQLAALALNLASARLEGCGGAGERTFERALRALRAGEAERAKQLAESVNTGRSVARCAGDRDEGEHGSGRGGGDGRGRGDGDGDGDDDSDGSSRGKGKDKSKEKAKDAGKGKGKSKDKG